MKIKDYLSNKRQIKLDFWTIAIKYNKELIKFVKLILIIVNKAQNQDFNHLEEVQINSKIQNFQIFINRNKINLIQEIPFFILLIMIGL